MHNGERMTKWYQDNLSKVNYDKYQAMVLGNPKGERNVDLDICDEKGEQSQSIKTLGVNPDKNRNFRDHIRSVCKNFGGMIGILRRRWFLGVADHQMTSPLGCFVFLTIIRFKFLFNLYKSSFRQTNAKFCRFVSTDKFTDKL